MYNSCVSQLLTLSPPIPLRLYTLPCWSNPGLSARVPECQKLKIIGYRLDQYGNEPFEFEQQQFRTAGIEGSNKEISRVAGR